MVPTLRSKRLVLEPYVPADEDDFVALFQDERVARWMGDGLAPEAEDRELFGRIFSKVYAEDRFDVWAVRQDGEYVGHAEIKQTEVVGGHELIYALTRSSWGMGLGTELADLIVDYGFGTLDLAEVHATVAEANHASLAVLGKLGFRHVRDVANDDGHTTKVLTRSRTADEARR